MYYIKVSQNVRLAVDIANETAKNTIIFVHGWPLNRKIFEHQLNVLPDLGYRVITFDIRGFGESDAPNDGYSYDRLAKDLYKLIVNLRMGNITLAGFSMGAAIAIRYMTLYRGYGVSKLALIGAAAPSFAARPNHPDEKSTQDIDEIISRLYKNKPQVTAEFCNNMFSIEHGNEFKSWFTGLAWDASGIGTIKTALSLRDEDLSPDLDSIHIPTGIFHGEKDLICPFRFAEELHNAIRHSTLYPFADSGHAVLFDQPDDFNLRLVEFLSK